MKVNILLLCVINNYIQICNSKYFFIRIRLQKLIILNILWPSGGHQLRHERDVTAQANANTFLYIYFILLMIVVFVV